MKTRLLMTMIIAAILTTVINGQYGARKWAFELNAGAAVPTARLGGSLLEPGFGFEGCFQYSFMQFASLYAGWGWTKFGAETSFAGEDMQFEETGYVLGLQLIRPLGASPVSLFIRGGALLNHIEVENDEGDVVEDTRHGAGWQLAGGVDVRLGSGWSFVPGLKYNHLNRELPSEEQGFRLNLNYFSLRAGFVKRF